MNVLGIIGFEPQLGADNREEHMLGLRLLFTIPPAILFFTAAAIVWNYPITAARHARMRATITRRDARRLAIATAKPIS